MIHASVLALALAAAAQAPSATVLLRSGAPAAKGCRTTRVDDRLVQAGLFAPESELCPVATAGDEVIVLRDLASALELGHLSRSPGAGAPVRASELDFSPALDRLIDTRLLVQEAREMRLDEEPAIRAAAEQFRASRLRAMVQQIAVQGVKPDPAEVERLYREAVREWKVKSVLLETEENAKAFEAALRAGEAFDALARRFLAEKRAKGGGEAEFVPPKQMLPEVRAAVEKARRGVPTGLVKVPSGWVVLRVDGVRHPKGDEARRAEARERSLARMEHEAVRRFYLSLVRKHAKVDERLLKRLDFEARGEKGFQKLLDDPRPLATIRGEEPITVADLAREVSRKFFHGLASPIEQRRVNPHKEETFERLLGARLFAKEAADRRLENRPSFRREVEEYERALAFDAFIQKVIAPEVKVGEAEALAYYEEHKTEFTAPQMFKLDGFAFATAGEAQAALDKLRAGTDFAWLRSTAPTQIAPEKRSLQLDGRTVSGSSLPPGLAKALTGSRSGEYRLYAHREAEVYVVRVVEQTPPMPQPYPDARESIVKRLVAERLTKSIRSYAAKLREIQPVRVFVTRVSP